MHFHHYGDMHIAIRITGPRHNFLAITFIPAEAKCEPQVIELPPQGQCEHRLLDREHVLDAVRRGVEEGNREYRTAYYVGCVQFVRNDTGPAEVYREMAKAIVREAKRYREQARLAFDRLASHWSAE